MWAVTWRGMGIAGGALLGGDVAVWLAMGGVVGLRRVVTWRWWWVASLSGGESTSTPWLGPSMGIDQGPDDGDGGHALVVVVVMGRRLVSQMCDVAAFQPRLLDLAIRGHLLLINYYYL